MPTCVSVCVCVCIYTHEAAGMGEAFCCLQVSGLWSDPPFALAGYVAHRGSPGGAPGRVPHQDER